MKHFIMIRVIQASHPKQLAKYVQLIKENQRTVQNVIVTNNYDTKIELKHHKSSNQFPNRNVRTPSEFHDYILVLIHFIIKCFNIFLM